MAVARHPAAPLTPAERLARTRELLTAAASQPDERDRRILLLKAGALNADAALSIASSFYRRYPHAPEDEQRLLSVARDAYLRAVLVLDPEHTTDVILDVLPALRAAVVAFGRGQEPSP